MPFALGVSAFLFWGFVPLFLRHLTHYEPLAILAYRIFWSIVILQIFVLLKPQSIEWKKVLKDKRSLALSFGAGMMLNISWIGFVYATISNQLFAASLAFYMTPVIVFFMGYLFFNEQVTKHQWIVFALLVFAIVFYIAVNHTAPVLSLVIAGAFALYFSIKKLSRFTTFENVYFEHLLFLPLVLLWMLIDPDSYSLSDHMMLFMTAPLQLIPVVLLGVAITHLDMKRLSAIQYIEPTLHLLLAVMVFHESVNLGQIGSTFIIWAALFYWYLTKKFA